MKHIIVALSIFVVFGCCKPQIKYVDKVSYVGNEIQIVPDVPERDNPRLNEDEKKLTEKDIDTIMTIINNLKTENKLLREQIQFYVESIKKHNKSVEKAKKIQK